MVFEKLHQDDVYFGLGIVTSRLELRGSALKLRHALGQASGDLGWRGDGWQVVHFFILSVG